MACLGFEAIMIYRKSAAVERIIYILKNIQSFFLQHFLIYFLSYFVIIFIIIYALIFLFCIAYFLSIGTASHFTSPFGSYQINANSIFSSITLFVIFNMTILFMNTCYEFIVQIVFYHFYMNL